MKLITEDICSTKHLWIECNHYEVLNTHNVNSMQSLRGVKYTQCE